MKIAVITNSFPKLCETYVLDHITGLIDRGHDVQVIARSDPQEPFAHGKIQIYGLSSKTVYVDPPTNWPTRLRYALRIFSRHVRTHRRELIKALDVRTYGRAALTLQTTFFLEPFLDTTFDVVHCHFGRNGLLFAFLKDLFDGFPLVVTYHGGDIMKRQYQTPGLYTNMFRKADLITAGSHFALQKVIQAGCPAEKATRIPMGVDVELYRLAERHPPEDGMVRILTTARLIEVKGHRYAIQAIGELSRRYRLRYDIVGDGPLESELRQMVAHLGLENTVFLLGQKTRQELIDLYHQAHIFLMASYTTEGSVAESQNVTLIEAQATGLPVVATRHNGFPDSVVEGQTAFLAAEKDAGALAKEIERMIQVADRWPEMGRAGRAFVVKNFDHHKLAEQWESHYNVLIRRCRSKEMDLCVEERA